MSSSPFDIPEWYTDEDDEWYREEYLPPISVQQILTPQSPLQSLIPQIWAKTLEDSLRRQLNLLGQELLDASISQTLYR